MISTIGNKRIFIILLLAGFLGFAYFYGVVVLKPKAIQNKNQLDFAKSEYDVVRQNMDKLRDGLNNFKDQEALFKKLYNLGFFSAQDRLVIRDTINELQKNSALISAKYKISRAKVIENEKAEEAEHDYLRTNMTFDLEAYDDRDIYHFIYLLTESFPGYISVKDLEITRNAEVTPALIKKIGLGEVIPMVTATLNVDLVTLVSNPNLKDSEQDTNYMGQM